MCLETSEGVGEGVLKRGGVANWKCVMQAARDLAALLIEKGTPRHLQIPQNLLVSNYTLFVVAYHIP